MIHVLQPTYILRIEIEDKPDFQSTSTTNPATPLMPMSSTPFAPQRRWFKEGKSGCDELIEEVRNALIKAGIEAEVFLERFEHK